MKIFEYINQLDKCGNYRLADKIENEVRKIYAQAIMQSPLTSRQSPGMQESHALNPNFAFILNQLLMKEQAKITQKKDETETLSPNKSTDINTLRKQVNKIISDGNITSKKIKTIENDLGALPALEGKVGQASEQFDELSTNVTDNTFNISENSKNIQVIQETLDTL
jgi:hypothetical protein